MKNIIVDSWDAVMNSERNPLRHLDIASQHIVMQALAWMWSMIFSLMFFSIYQFGITWVLHMLLIAGMALTVSVFKMAEKKAAAQVSVRADEGYSA